MATKLLVLLFLTVVTVAPSFAGPRRIIGGRLCPNSVTGLQFTSRMAEQRLARQGRLHPAAGATSVMPTIGVWGRRPPTFFYPPARTGLYGTRR